MVKIKSEVDLGGGEVISFHFNLTLNFLQARKSWTVEFAAFYIKNELLRYFTFLSLKLFV